jgi:hypothetical protein
MYKMPNVNGLIGCGKTTNTGDPESNIYLRKGDPLPAPIVVSPLIVESISGDMMEITVDDAGTTLFLGTAETVIQPAQEDGVVQIKTDRGVTITPQTSNGNASMTFANGEDSTVLTSYAITNAGTNAEGLVAGTLEIYGYSEPDYTVSRRCIACSPLGDRITLGSDATVGGSIVEVDGAQGVSRVYDPLYNPVPIPVSAQFGSYLTQSGQVANKQATFDTLPQGNIFTNISGSFAFNITKTGKYLFQCWAAAGLGSGELKLNGTAISAIAPGTASLSSGAFFYLQNLGALPPTIYNTYQVSMSYQQLKDNQAVGPSGGTGITVSTMLDLASGTQVGIYWSAGQSATDGLVRCQLIQMC